MPHNLASWHALLCSFDTAGPAPKWRDGRQERTGSPAGEGGPHPKGRNEMEELGQGSDLRHAAAGLQGSDAHTAKPDAGGTRRRAQMRDVRMAGAKIRPHVMRS